MEAEFTSLSALLLMFVLGLRHGLDPDHIAVIDGMTYRNLEQRTTIAPWIGTLFALGHGLTVTLFAVVFSLIARRTTMPAVLVSLAEWLPIALLLLIGTLNLRSLLCKEPYQVRGWKSAFIPSRFREGSRPLAVLVTGALFALMFDTATQLAAWTYTSTSSLGVKMAVVVGLIFTLGMVITDTIDSQLMCRLLRRVSDTNTVTTYRRGIGWTVVALSYGIAAYEIASRMTQVNDTSLAAIGFFPPLALLLANIGLSRNTLRNSLSLSTFYKEVTRCHLKIAVCPKHRSRFRPA